MSSPSRQEILDKFSAIVGKSLHVDAALVTEDSRLNHDDPIDTSA
jgi:hypothetical protein